ncbi:MAG: hypothetical protein D8M58_11615 [Calditrichaeota bacterium]|nr:MAG: hypothetical protein DWQ03_10990 [Calditrichota bacterium]MBL1206042.1 hypothetical protein [Calditrichota bacterium]NOG45870.1 hypothetical protein [Calditrichota bacterium]
MNQFLRLFALLVSVSMLLFAVSCSESDSGTDSNGDDAEAWVGKWLSAGDNIAPLLTSFSIDSIYVTMNEDGSIVLDQHVIGAGWSTNSGTYSVTKSATGDVHSISISYSSPSFDQGGIIEVTEGTSATMQLEVVQTNPDIGAVPPTVTAGFGSTNGGALGTINIQNYVAVE